MPVKRAEREAHTHLAPCRAVHQVQIRVWIRGEGVGGGEEAEISGAHDRLVRKAHVEGCAGGAAEGYGFSGVRDGDVVAGKVARRVDASGSRWCGQAIGTGTDGTKATEVRKGLRGGRDATQRRAKER